MWIVADELLEQRTRVWQEMQKWDKLLGIEVFKIENNKYERSLASSYKHAMNMARDMEAMLFVSLQDYFWVPPYGVERFLKAALQWPDCLFTGHASIADNPGPEAVANPEGAFTIFAQPYGDKPKESWWWREVRGPDKTDWYESNPIEWELNWAAIPHNVLMADVDFDPELDKGIACENQDYALACRDKLGTHVLSDPRNHAIGLPHKLYFPEQTQANADVLHFNREYMEQKWGIPT